MGIWGSIALSWKFSIVLGTAIGLTFFAGLIKLVVIRRRLAKNQKLQDLEAAEKSSSQVALAQRSFGEGDLFGVRAIQSGFYGGVSQISFTPPGSSASSSRNSPVDDGSEGSAASSLTDLALGKPASSSTTLFKSASRKVAPPPINSRLQPSDAELNGRMNHDPSMRFRSYTPTSPRSPRSPLSFDSGTDKISRSPRTLPEQQNLTSPLNEKLAEDGIPRLIIPSATISLPELVTTPNNPTASIKSDMASMTTLVLPARPDPAALKSPTLSLFPNQPSRRDVLPVLPPRLSSRDVRPKDIPPVPHSLRVPPAPPSPDSPSIQLRALSGVSIWSDNLLQELAKEKRKTQLSHMTVRLPSGYPSSLSSFSMHNDDPTSADEKVQSSRRRTRSPSNKHSRQSSDGSDGSNSSRERGIRRTQNSIRHARKPSAEPTAASAASRRRSLQRDAMHYDPSLHRRTPSGSILARRPIDFDHPRSSPFSPSSNEFAASVSTTLEPSDANLSRQKSKATFKSISKSLYSNRSRGSSLDREVHLSVAEKVTMTPTARRSATRVSRVPESEPKKRVKETGKSSGAKSREEVIEAYYRAARLSRVHGKGELKHVASLAALPLGSKPGIPSIEVAKGGDTNEEWNREGEGNMDTTGLRVTSKTPGSAGKRDPAPTPAVRRPESMRLRSAFAVNGYRQIDK